MKKILLIGIAAVVGAASLYGQEYTVSGYVRDADNGEPLTGAVVAESGGTGGATANQAGFWSMRLPAGRHTLGASHIGYAAETSGVDITSDTTVNFLLGRSVVTLDAVVVKPENERFSIRGGGQIGVNISQVRYAPALLGEPDIIKYLQTMPGVSSGREGSSQLLVRGGGADETLMMLDDIPIYNNNHAFGLVSVFNADAMSGAELYKGYVPARYGGRLSSVASLRMRDGNRNRHSQSVTLGTLTIGGLAEGPVNKGKGSYIVSARMFYPELLLRPIYALTKPEQEVLYSFYDVNAKLNYALGQRNRLYLSLYNGGDSFSDKLYLLEGDTEGEREWAYTNGMAWGNASAAVKLETRAGNDIFISNSIYFSRIGNRTRSIEDHLPDDDDTATSTRSNLYETGFRTTVEQKAGRSHSFTYGVHAAMQGFMPQHTIHTEYGTSTERTIRNRRLWSGSLFADDRISLRKITLDIGVRVSAFHNGSKPEWGVEPRASINWRPSPSNSATLSYTRTVQPLFSIIKPYMGLPMDFWLPYDNEKISSARQISAGWANTSIKGLTLSLDAYYKSYRDLSLIFDPDDYLIGESDAIPANGYAYGIEMAVLFTRGRWSLSGAYTYSRSMRTALGVTFPFEFDIPHSANIFASLTTLRKAGRTHTLSMNMNMRSGLPFVVKEGMFANIQGGFWSDNYNDNPLFPNVRLKPYFRTDLSYSMERKKKNGTRTWQISILNVTAYNNPYIVYPSGTGYAYRTLIPIMPSFSYKRTF